MICTQPWTENVFTFIDNPPFSHVWYHNMNVEYDSLRYMYSALLPLCNPLGNLFTYLGKYYTDCAILLWLRILEFRYIARFSCILCTSDFVHTQKKLRLGNACRSIRDNFVASFNFLCENCGYMLNYCYSFWGGVFCKVC